MHPRGRRHSSLRNDTSEITSGGLQRSQAGVCYWGPYSLCGTKAMQKVLISPKIVTVATSATPPTPTPDIRGPPGGGCDPATEAAQITFRSRVGHISLRWRETVSRHAVCPASVCTNLSPPRLTGSVETFRPNRALG
ncbi:hypothetical protein C0216_27090 [Streptomyces globosus]|uniref:Uncharacterized protein n=1 Tax=Streptomyces globosus TaxID=68209 RepID=A0A344U6U6_9ACTN|nr:hypothetical protein C0216_27090 [Streptomyces globosus]